MSKISLISVSWRDNSALSGDEDEAIVKCNKGGVVGDVEKLMMAGDQ